MTKLNIMDDSMERVIGSRDRQNTVECTNTICSPQCSNFKKTSTSDVDARDSNTKRDEDDLRS